MAQFINPKSNAASKIDGIIKEFILQSESITAGEFVNFIDQMNVDYEETLLKNQYTGDCLKAVKLTDTKAIVFHRSDSNTLSVNVANIANNTVTLGSAIVVGNNTGDCYHYDAVALDDSHIFLAFSRTVGQYYLYSKVLYISGTSVTIGSEKQLSSESNSGLYNKVIKVSESRVLVIHTNSNLRILAMLCDVANMTITSGTDVEVCGVSSSASYFNAVALDSNRVFVAHPKSQSANVMNGFIITINGDTLTAGEDHVLVDDFYSNTTQIELIDDNKVLIIYCSTSQCYLHAVVCEIDGSAIAHGNAVALSDGRNTGFGFIQKLETDKVAIFYPFDNSNSYMYCAVCSVDGLYISRHVEKQLSTAQYSGQDLASIMGENQVVLFHSSNGTNTYLAVKLLSEELYATEMTTKDNPYGIAMKKASYGDLVKVAMPKV